MSLMSGSLTQGQIKAAFFLDNSVQLDFQKRSFSYKLIRLSFRNHWKFISVTPVTRDRREDLQYKDDDPL